MDKETIDRMREVINQHSKDLKKLVEVIEGLKARLDSHDRQLSKMNDVVTEKGKPKNPFDGLF